MLNMAGLAVLGIIGLGAMFFGTIITSIGIWCVIDAVKEVFFHWCGKKRAKEV